MNNHSSILKSALILLGLSYLTAQAQPVTPDFSFSSPDAKEIFTDGVSAEYFVDMAIDALGRQVYVASTNYDPDEGGNSRGIAMRLNPDGTRDPAWGNNGIVTIDFPNSNDQLFGVALDNNNNVIICGRTNIFDAALFKLRASNGSLDPSFGVGGRAVFATADEFNDVVVLSNQRIVAVGSGVVVSSQDNDYIVARFMSNGSLDASFGTNNGFTNIDFEDDDYANHVAVEADGDLVVAGKSQTCSSANCEDMSITKLKSNGQIDVGFGPSGTGKMLFKTTPQTGEAFIYSLLLQNIQGEERIILSGSHEPNTDEYAGFIWRMRNNGNTESWGGSSIGFVSLPEMVSTVATLRSDNRLLLASSSPSFVGSNLYFRTRVMGRKADGTLDPSSGNNGLFDLQVAPFIDIPVGIRTHSNKIYVFGIASANANFGPDYNGYVVRLISGNASAVEEPEWAKSVVIFPNPAQGNVQINLQITESDELMFSITDLFGRQIWQRSEQASAGENQIKIQLPEAISPGQYLLSISTKEGAITRRLVVL